MHEMAIVQDIIDTVTEACLGKRVRRVVLEIGALSSVVPDAIAACFEIATSAELEASPLTGARLEIIEIPGRGKCRACGAEVVMIDPLGECGCGGLELDWMAGTQLTIRELEVV
ncbi:MAG: hydrogenase maturation nickel metallochaperone HypA [Deltaproteobacteria bacterium]|nr:hydrogenase maturation nickel metallochaperone HypA [Deltaproteobacteria bacterium]